MGIEYLWLGARRTNANFLVIFGSYGQCVCQSPFFQCKVDKVES